MTHDVTTLILEAQDARGRMQEAKKRIKSEVRRKYEQAIARDIAEATADAEVEFARVLARVHASGISQAVLRREVLRTNVWSEWTKWRDLADIAPERVTVANARKSREEAARDYRWNDDYTVLTVTRYDGEDLANPFIVLDWEVSESGTPKISYPDSLLWSLKRGGVDYLKIDNTAAEAVRTAYDAGVISDRLGNYAQYQNGDISLQEYEIRQSEILMQNGEWK